MDALSYGGSPNVLGCSSVLEKCISKEKLPKWVNFEKRHFWIKIAVSTFLQRLKNLKLFFLLSGNTGSNLFDYRKSNDKLMGQLYKTHTTRTFRCSSSSRGQGDVVLHEGLRGHHRARRQRCRLRWEPRSDGRRQRHWDVLSLWASYGKLWQWHGQFRIFCLFLSFSHKNFNHTNWKSAGVCLSLEPIGCRMVGADESTEPWSSLVEGDEQLDRPNSQTTVELCHACVAYFFGFNTNTTDFCLGQSSLHLLLLKSSMTEL